MKLNIPQDKEGWLAAMRQRAENSTFTYLGIELIDVDEDGIEMQMPITDKVRQPMGVLHGGINMVLAESAASIHACWGVDLNEKVPYGVEINGSHLNSATEGTVRAVGKVIRRSRSLIVHQVDIYLIETEKHLSTARVTNFYKEVRKR